MWAEQERRDRSERQGELGAEMTDNRKRVRIQQVGNDGEDMEVLLVDKEKGRRLLCSIVKMNLLVRGEPPQDQRRIRGQRRRKSC
jgi:hypothetical protein